MLYLLKWFCVECFLFQSLPLGAATVSRCMVFLCWICSFSLSVNFTLIINTRVKILKKYARLTNAGKFYIFWFFLFCIINNCIKKEYPPLHFGWTSKRGLNKENRVVSQLFFYALILHSTLRLDSVYGIKKPEPNDSGFPCSGDTTRTCDLRVMSPTSCQLLHPAIYRY